MSELIIQVFGTLGAGGAESRMMDVYRNIDKQHVQFAFVTLDKSKNQFYEKEILSLGGSIIKISSPKEKGLMRHFSELLSTFKYLKQQGAIAIHSHTLYHCGIVCMAARVVAIPVRIAHSRNTDTLNGKTFVGRMQVNIGKVLIKIFATHCLALNKECAEYLYGKGCIESGKATVLPNAIDLTKYKMKKRAQLPNVPDDALVIGHVGRFQPMKNHTFLIDFFAKFHTLYPESYLVMVGDGPQRQEIAEKVESLSLSKYVRFLGLRNDVYALMPCFNLFVFPSIFEGLAGVLLEAEAAGIPCLVSDTIPSTADMNLGLIKFISLNKDLSEWCEEAAYLLEQEKPDYSVIEAAFKKRHFTLEQEISDLYSIYGV